MITEQMRDEVRGQMKGMSTISIEIKRGVVQGFKDGTATTKHTMSPEELDAMLALINEELTSRKS